MRHTTSRHSITRNTSLAARQLLHSTSPSHYCGAQPESRAMALDMFEFTVLRWKLPILHARELDDIAYEKIIDEGGDYDEFIAACQVVYRGAARTAEVTRYLVLLVMFSRATMEPVDGRKAKMETLFQWATGEAPTTKGKAGRLGAALRVSHFLFCHGKYMDAFVLDRYFSLNSVIDCPKALLVDDHLLTRLFEELTKSRHSTTQVAEVAHRILHDSDNDKEDEKHQQASISRIATGDVPQPARPRLLSIKAVKEDGTYLVHTSNRSRCVSLTKETIISTKGGKAMLTAFLSTLRAEAAVQTRSIRKEHAVVEVSGRRAKQHQALLEGNQSRRWYPTTQLLLWKDGKTKVEEYDALHPVSPVAPDAQDPAFFVPKEQAYYVDQVSKEPLTDPYTLVVSSHRESYNRSSWQSLLVSRSSSSPVLRAPIEFYQRDGLAVFLPQPDPALKAEVALWLLTAQGRAYSTDGDSIFTAPVSDSKSEEDQEVIASSSPRMEVEGTQAVTDVALNQCSGGTDAGAGDEGCDSSDEVEYGGHQLDHVQTIEPEVMDASASRDDIDVLPSGPSTTQLDDANHQVRDDLFTVDNGDEFEMLSQPLNSPAPYSPAVPTGLIIEVQPHSSESADPVHITEVEGRLKNELSSSRAEVETLRAQLERIKQQLKAASIPLMLTSSARRRLQVRSILPTVERITLIKELRGAQKVDQTTNFLTDDVMTYFMEVLNHHNHLLHLQDQHAYCFDPQVVTRAEVGDGYGLRAFDPIAADAARYWLLPRNTPRHHWWLDIYDRFRHVLYRADSASVPHSMDPLRSRLWPENPPEVRDLKVPQQKDGVSCGDYVIQFAIVIASPGWYPDSGTLSRVLPWDRSEMLSQLDSGSWETQRPEPMLALSQTHPELNSAPNESAKPQRRARKKRKLEAATASGLKRKLDHGAAPACQHDVDPRTTEVH
jgi:hypothetical protein